MTPGQLKVERIIDYSVKEGLNLWKTVIEPLPNKFDTKASRMATFVEDMNQEHKSFDGQRAPC